MASSHTKVTIGAFTLGSIALFILALVYLGGERFFKPQSEYVLYFDGSVSGLNVGAPVVFRGVPLGNVTRISLVFDRKSSAITIPVYIHLDESSIVRMSGEKFARDQHERIINHMVRNGLSARLKMQSLVTGQYRIELDYHTNETPIFRLKNALNEIPTVPSPIDTIQKTISEMPLRDLSHAVNNIIVGISKAVGDGSKLQASIDSFYSAFRTMERTFATLEETIKKSVLRTSADATLKNMQSLTGTLASDLPKILVSLEQTVSTMAKTAERLQNISRFAEQTFSANSPAMQDMRRLFREAADAARSLHNLADMLNRNPEALLKGKQHR